MSGQTPAAHGVLLCADDYGICEGVSRGITELAEARRISATSAIVTLPRWSGDAPRLAALQDKVAVGLHLNLTLGSPLGAMPGLCPTGHFPGIKEITRKALTGRIDVEEIADETRRQLERFEARTGMQPDFLDGHQHVHALARVRSAVLQALEGFEPSRKILLRDPADTVTNILARGLSTAKAMAVSVLALGFGAEARRRGFSTNDTFSGFSDFALGSPFEEELERAFRAAGPRHLVMCHPGHPDEELKALDPVHARRKEELDALMTAPWIPGRISHPARDGVGKALLFGAGAPS